VDWLDGLLLPEKQKWDLAWDAYVNPATRNPILIFAKKQQRKAYEKRLRVLVKSLQSNIHVTPEDFQAMGIAIISAGKTPSLVASEAPDADVDTSVIGRLTIHFFRWNRAAPQR
jgi:hypothetical protein